MKENQKLVPREDGFFLWDNFPGGFFPLDLFTRMSF